jgi:hypothetical protein
MVEDLANTKSAWAWKLLMTVLIAFGSLCISFGVYTAKEMSNIDHRMTVIENQVYTREEKKDLHNKLAAIEKETAIIAKDIKWFLLELGNIKGKVDQLEKQVDQHEIIDNARHSHNNGKIIYRSK